MQIRNGFIVLLLAAVPMTGYAQSASSPYSLVDKSAISIKSDGSASSVGYARILPTSATTPSGVAIYGYTPANVLVGEAGVPASPLLKNGRIYAEVGPNGFAGAGTDIGLAIANPGAAPATISYTFTNASGVDAGSGSLSLAAGAQTALYLDQLSVPVPVNFQGTFSFSSTTAISVVALQQYTNARGEGLFTTLPVLNLDPGATPTTTTPAVLSQFADGAGWTTEVLLVNPTTSPISGTIQFLTGTTGAPLSLTIGGSAATSFSYSIASHSSYKLVTAGTNAAGSQPATGSVVITPAAGSVTPFSLGVFSFATNTIIAQAGVPSSLGKNFRAYVEATTAFGSTGSYSTGFAVANASATAGSITLELFTPDGSATPYTTTLPIAANGQFAKFLSDVFPTLTLPFQGILRISTTTPSISVVALRIRFNERAGEFLETTTPATEENATPPTGELDFPQIADGFGFKTQFVLFSGYKGQAASGTLSFVNPKGSPLSLNNTSTIQGTAPTLTAISPATAVQGSTVTLTGTGFSASTKVSFSTASGPASVTPTVASATSMTAVVPATAVSGPVQVANGSLTSSALILQVTKAGGAQLQTSVTVGASATTTGVDIYVPGAVSLVPSFLGLADVGASGLNTQGTSVEISRGQSKLLGVNGTGVQAGTTLSISGSGVAVNNVQVSGTLVYGTIVVDSSAATGARNIIITNANGDTAILTGGILIQ